MTTGTPGAPPPYAGRTTIRPQAIRRVAEAVAGDTAGVPASVVTASLSDERGRLVVHVSSPIELGVRAATKGSLVDRAGELAAAVTAGLDDLTSRSVGRVDVRITGVRRSDDGRVL